MTRIAGWVLSTLLTASPAVQAQEDPYLWLEDVTGDKAMAWVRGQNAVTQPLLESRPDIRPDLALNEGGGSRLALPDGRVVQTVGVGEKGMAPMTVTASTMPV